MAQQLWLLLHTSPLLLLLVCFCQAAPLLPNSVQGVPASLLDELSFMEQYAAASYCGTNIESNYTISSSNSTIDDSTIAKSSTISKSTDSGSNTLTMTITVDNTTTNYFADNSTLVTCPAGNCPRVEAAGARVLVKFAHVGLLDVTGFMAVDHTNKLIVISFRGSQSLGNWIGNFNFEPLPSSLCRGCLVHAGFYASWAFVRDGVNETLHTATERWPDYDIAVVGHSLGGAIATISAGELRVQGYPHIWLYTYGSPMVGNVLLAHVITNQGNNFRVTRYQDCVPKLPGYPLGYAHVSPEYWIDLPGQTYPSPEDIRVSDGAIDLWGNVGTLGFSVADHLWYFNGISACSTIL